MSDDDIRRLNRMYKCPDDGNLNVANEMGDQSDYDPNSVPMMEEAIDDGV
jgi:hypothetical protein